MRLRAPSRLDLAIGVFQGGLLQPGAGTAIQSRTTKDAEGRTVTEWVAVDQPAIRREDGLPPLEVFAPALLISAGDWQAIPGASSNLERAAASSAAVADGAHRLALPTTRRQCGPARRPRHPDSARRTVPAELPLGHQHRRRHLRDSYQHDRYRDPALRLLRQAGFRPQFVLASSVPAVAVCETAAHTYPAAGRFPDVLVRVKVAGLGPVYLNDTDQYAILGATAHDGQLGLAVRNGHLERIEAAAKRRDAQETGYVIQLDAEGNADVSFSRTSRGGAYGGENRKFSEMPPEERRRYYEETVAGLSQNAEAKGDLETDFATYPGSERFAARVTNLAVRDGDYLYLSLPRTLANLLGLRADERTNPLFWAGPRRFRIVTDLALPPGFTEAVLTPQEFFWNAPADAGSVWVGVTRQGPSSLRIIHDVDLRPAILPATVYPELLDVNRQLSHPAAGTLLLRRTPAAQP